MAIDATSETAIFERIVLPREPLLSPDAARSILALDFDPEDRKRLEELAEKARQGTLSHEESQEIDHYERVGHYLSILHAKARSSLGDMKKS
jgi:hypothetical protein